MIFRTIQTIFTTVVLSISLSAFTHASANPATANQDATVVSGQATLSADAATTSITQSNQTAVINWRDFSTRAGDNIHIHQPNALAMAIIRVQGDSPSYFNGRLTANGQVVIVNANGIVAGKTAQFNTAGLVLSTGTLSERDAKHNNYRFQSATAPIDFHGTIDGGYVAMTAQQVTNRGNINANGGRVALTAADSVTLRISQGNFAGVLIDKGALDALADNVGLIQSSGGTVHMTATASSEAASANVNHSGVISANTTTRPGEIMLISDMGVGKTTVSGALYAKADGVNGDIDGNGGFIDTSGATVNIADTAKVSTKAINGKTGTWLIDPTDFTISSGTAAQTTSGIGNITLQTALSSNNVELQTAGTGAGSGDIHVNAPVNWSSNTLILNAHNDININSNLNATGTAGLTLKYGQQANGQGDYYINAPVNLASTATFTTQKGSTATNKKPYMMALRVFALRLKMTATVFRCGYRSSKHTQIPPRGYNNES